MFLDNIVDELMFLLFGLLCLFLLYIIANIIRLSAKCCIRYTRNKRKLNLEEPTVDDMVDACENDSVEEFNELYDWMKVSHVDINQTFRFNKHTHIILSYTIEYGKFNILKYILSNNIVNINSDIYGYACIATICINNITDEKTCEMIMSLYTNVHGYKCEYPLFRWCLKYFRLDLLKLLIKRKDFDINRQPEEDEYDVSHAIDNNLDFYLDYYFHSYSYTCHRLDKDIDAKHVKIMKLLLHNGIHVTDDLFEYDKHPTIIKQQWKTMYSCDWSIFTHKCYLKEFKDSVIHMLIVLKNIHDCKLPRDIKYLIIMYTARVYKSDY